jgi:histidine triad (HIT) family protein
VAVTDCIFCRIVDGDLPSTVLAESERAMAFADINPAAPMHAVVVPRNHHPDVAALSADPDDLTAVVALAARVAREAGVADTGWRLVFNTGADGGQTVAHVHGHVLGGRGLTWPPG